MPRHWPRFCSHNVSAYVYRVFKLSTGFRINRQLKLAFKQFDFCCCLYLYLYLLLLLCFFCGAAFIYYLFVCFVFNFLILFLIYLQSRSAYFFPNMSFQQFLKRKNNLDQVLVESGTITSTGVVLCKFHSLITTIRSRILDSALNISGFTFVLYFYIDGAPNFESQCYFRAFGQILMSSLKVECSK